VVALALTGLVAGAALAADRTGWPKEIKFGVIPSESSSALSDKFEPIVKFLEKELDVKIKLFYASDYRGIIEALRFKKIEMAHLGPKSYIEAADNYGNVEPIVKFILDNGSSGYRSCLIANTKTDIFSPEDARGARFAFNDPNSTSGYLVPMLLFLNEMKVDPEKYFARVIFSGSHEASLIAVANGTVDVASTNLPDVKKITGSGKVDEKHVRVIWVSPLIPNDLIAVRTDLPTSFKQALEKAWVEIGRKEPEALKLGQWSAFVPVDDAHYQPIREMNKVKKLLDSKAKPK
jgi:phosphonate transport system substrate-binding protein